MKKSTLVMISILLLGSLFGQKHDYVWHMGSSDIANEPEDTVWGKSVINFYDSLSSPNLYYNSESYIDYYGVNSTISDEEGNYLFTYNGTYIEDASNNVMVNGANMSESGHELGDAQQQGGLTIRLPDSERKYVLFHQSSKWFDDDITYAGHKLYYSVIDMHANNGLGAVVSKRNLLIEDTLDYGKITATQHANGKDWWVLVPGNDNDEYHIIILTPEGPEVLGVQHTGQVHLGGLGNACFSPDGSKYAKFSSTNAIVGNDLYFYDFDRCSGMLSNPEAHNYDINENKPGSIAISPSSEVLYLFSHEEVYQFDLTADTIEDTKKLIAENDGYVEHVPGTTFYTPHSFYMSQLGPDGKIYVSSYHNNRLLTTVEYPDKLGESCQVAQHSVHVPTMITTVPNFPNYRLGPLDGSPCDTLGIDNIPLSRFRIDQDTSDYLKFQFVELADYAPDEWVWSLGDGSSSIVKNPNHTYSAPGVYKVCLTVRNENGTDVNCKKINIATTSTIDQVADTQIGVYPNPCTSFLNIQLVNYYPGESFLFLYDAQGRMVKEQRLLYGQNTIPVYRLPAGMYFYKIIDKGVLLKNGKVLKE